MSRLIGKVAVVTGAGRSDGLGAAIAHRLAQDGAHVVVSDIGRAVDNLTLDAMIGAEDGMAQVVEAIIAAGGSASAHPCDVRQWKEVKALAGFAANKKGGLDIWVNNAGIGYIMKPLLEVSPEEWGAVIDVNLTGSFLGLKAAAAEMVARRKGGRIINIASQAAKSGFPFAQAYCASKHGLVGLVRSAAIELGAHDITVNNVCPNHVTTGLGAWQNDYFAAKTGRSLDQYMADMVAKIPMGRAGLPDDTANAVAFLASDEARYITAESLNVSGGEESH